MEVPKKRLANQVAIFHVFYVLSGLLFSLATIVSGIPIFAFLGVAWYITSPISCLYWGSCPLTLLERSLRNGEGQDTYRWRKLKKTFNTKQIMIWLFVQPILLCLLLLVFTMVLLL